METADPAPVASITMLIVSGWSLPARDHFLGEAHVSGPGLTDFISWNPQIMSFLITIIPIFQMRRLSFREVRLGFVRISADVCIGADYCRSL